MNANAANAMFYQERANAAANALTDEWIAAARALATLATEVSDCETVAPGLRELAKRHAITSIQTANAATAITTRTRKP